MNTHVAAEQNAQHTHGTQAASDEALARTMYRAAGFTDEQIDAALKQGREADTQQQAQPRKSFFRR